jgi:predicted Fe-Mo cluster-binding NifX family protein
MKIAVTSLGESLESPVDQRFGRTRYFVLYDLETGEWSAHNNKQNLQAAQGAGIQAAQHVVNLGAEAVITGHCGPKAFVTLSAADIAIYQDASGSVQDALGAYRAGSLKEASQADVDAGYGSV